MCPWSIVTIIYVVCTLNSSDAREISSPDAATLDNHVSTMLIIILTSDIRPLRGIGHNCMCSGALTLKMHFYFQQLLLVAFLVRQL